jgi:hypothetical protein
MKKVYELTVQAMTSEVFKEHAPGTYNTDADFRSLEYIR